MLRFKKRELFNSCFSHLEGETYLMRGLLGSPQDLLLLYFLGHGFLARGRALEHLILSGSCILVLDHAFRRFFWRWSEFLLNPLHRIPIASGGRDQGMSRGVGRATYARRLE